MKAVETQLKAWRDRLQEAPKDEKEEELLKRIETKGSDRVMGSRQPFRAVSCAMYGTAAREKEVMGKALARLLENPRGYPAVCEGQLHAYATDVLEGGWVEQAFLQIISDLSYYAIAVLNPNRDLTVFIPRKARKRGGVRKVFMVSCLKGKMVYEPILHTSVELDETQRETGGELIKQVAKKLKTMKNQASAIPASLYDRMEGEGGEKNFEVMYHSLPGCGIRVSPLGILEEDDEGTLRAKVPSWSHPIITLASWVDWPPLQLKISGSSTSRHFLEGFANTPAWTVDLEGCMATMTLHPGRSVNVPHPQDADVAFTYSAVTT
eukprot:TRINITY_DN37707_c0_g1_i1.p1 TRINITY_DN37707_c0_g1~~TRINITY_DN37707_c0_g1_i1.p1  ORF type:complete len:322 (+),score=59.06 TRINITY_DN37707_c0_g1_i1:47-1012(+)